MNPRLSSITAFFVGLWLWSAFAFAGVEQISEKEFKDLAQELGGKVNLFQEAWKNSPEAEFYGGTTRDYLYWLKGQFINAHNHEEAAAVIKQLRAAPIIDVRAFIIGDSDVDIISTERGAISAEDFGVRKIDFQPRDILDPSTELGKNEILQGYIPAEKIRLAKDGFHATGLGDGISEIYHGKLSVHFASAEDFAKSKYAREGINHPILLALRYIRLQAINYYRSHGKEFPDFAKLHAGMDEASALEVKEIIQRAVGTNELAPYLEQNKFKSWINGAIQKSFRSYTNPTAALELMKEFGVPELTARYPKEIEPLNQYVFAKFRDPAVIAENFEKFRVNESAFFTPPAQFFPDGKLYHGTKTEPAFRGILFQGALPSGGGSAGAGLYGVAESDKKFSEEWAGDKNLLLNFSVKPQAKIVDITTGEGKRVWEAAGLGYEDFADRFGVDILRYPYDTQAFVVKNASVLSGAQGVYRSVKPLSELLEDVKKSHGIEDVLKMLSVNALSAPEKLLLWQASPVKKEEVIAYLRSPSLQSDGAKEILTTPFWLGQLEIDDLLETWVTTRGRNPLFQIGWTALLSSPQPSAARLALIDRLMGLPERVDQTVPRDTVYHYLKNHSSPMPISTEHAIQSIKRRMANNALPLSAAEIYYLQSAPLTPAQISRLRAAYTICSEDKNLVVGQSQVGKILIKQPELREEFKKHFLQMFNKPKVHFNNQWFFGHTLLEEFLYDPEVESAALKFFLTHQAKLLERENNTLFLTVTHTLRHLAPIKSTLLNSLAKSLETQKFPLLQALSMFKFNDEELAQLVDSYPRGELVAARKFHAAIVSRYEQGAGPKSVMAMLRNYNRPDILGAEIHAAFERVIHSYPDKSLPQSFIADQLKKLMNLPPIDVDDKAARNLFTLMTNGTVPNTLALQNQALDLVEKYAGSNKFIYFDSPQLRGLSLEDPGIARRVTEKIVRNDIGYPLTQLTDFLAVLKRLPQTGELKNFLATKIKPNLDQTPQDQAMRDFLTSSLAINPNGCASDFAQLPR